jgi:CBS domain-containing protein
MQVKEVMYKPEPGEIIGVKASLEEAVHQLVVGSHQSLLVVNEDKDPRVVGILKLTDVFHEIVSIMKDCKL